MQNNIYEKEINIASTHLLLKTDINVKIDNFIIKQREIIQKQIDVDKKFNGYEKVDIIQSPRILNLMTKAGQIAEIGPMSSVAGSISQICLEYMEKYNTKYTVLENGGDIALKSDKKIKLGIYAGKSIFTNNIALKLKEKPGCYGICTSSGTVGPSKSFGLTDATIVLGKEASICDSLATRIGNYGTGTSSYEIVNNALEEAENYLDYCDGVIVIKEEYLAKVGRIPKIIKIK
jgi:ApbE superfamily uncharacterized protein (UPF0280 family)